MTNSGISGDKLGLAETYIVTRVYFQIADNRLKGALHAEFSGQMIRTRYGLTSAQLSAVLTRISQEVRAERKPGYGWAFSSMLTTPDSLLKSYWLRLALAASAMSSMRSSTCMC